MSIGYARTSNAFNLPHVGRRVICAVAQEPFTDSNGVALCSVQPLIFDDGTSVEDNAFPSHDYVRWMVASNEGSFARTGRLVSVVVEEDRRAGQENMAWYRVRKGTVKEPSGNGYVEIVRLEHSDGHDLARLISEPIAMSHLPAAESYLLIQDRLVGPFRIENATLAPNGEYSVQFDANRNAAGEREVLCLYQANATSLGGPQFRHLEALVSLDESAPYSSDADVVVVNYYLAKKDLLDADLHDAERVSVEPDSVVLKKLMDRFRMLNRTKRNAIRDYLQELESETIDASENYAFRQILTRVKRLAAKDDDGLTELANTIVEGGFADRHLQKALDDAITRLANEIRAAAEAKALDVHDHLKAAEQQLSTVRADIATKQGEAERLISEARKSFNHKIEVERQSIATERAELTALSEKLEAHLGPVVQRMEQAGQEVVNQYLTLAPLLQRVAHPAKLTDKTTRFPSLPARNGPKLTDSESFVSEHLWPELVLWDPEITRTQAETLHLATLACKGVFVPSPFWGTAHAEATGGLFELLDVQPDWLSFSKVWADWLEPIWRAAAELPNRVFLVMFDGVDRAPTSAWAKPLLNVIGGFSGTVANTGCSWPSNLRLLWGVERGPASFEVDPAFFSASGAVPMTPVGDRGTDLQASVTHTSSVQSAESQRAFVDGGAWIAWSAPDCEVTYADELTDAPASWRRAMGIDIGRIAQILVDLGREPESAVRLAKRIRIDNIADYCNE